MIRAGMLLDPWRSDRTAGPGQIYRDGAPGNLTGEFDEDIGSGR